VQYGQRRSCLMKIAYILLYDIGDGAAEVSGVYSSLISAKNAVGVGIEWKENLAGLWEAYTDRLWYIEAHGLQD